MKRIFLFSALVVFLGHSAAGAEVEDCRALGETEEMVACAERQYLRADDELGAAWEAILANARNLDRDRVILSDDGRTGYETALWRAQSLWTAFRDSACQYEGYQARGEDLEPVIAVLCLGRMTRTRSAELQRLLQDMGTQ